MEILVGGVGDAFSVKHHGTHFLVRHDGFTLLVDCPDAFRRALHENEFEDADGRTLHEGDIDAVYLTHLHGDHVNGLEMLLAFRAMVLRRPVALWTIPEVADVIWERRLQVSLGRVYDGTGYRALELADFASLHVVPWGEPTEIGPMTVTTRPTRHHLPTSALRIQADDATFAYSCDTAWDPELVDWLFDAADLVFHESSHGPAHTGIDHLNELSESRRQRLRVVHYPDELVQTSYPGLHFAVEGESYRIPQAFAGRQGPGRSSPD